MTSPRYADAGVDLEAADAAKTRIGELVAGTRTALSAGTIGAFGGMIRLPADVTRPVLVMSTDGVGTKVLIAQQVGRLDTVGEDLVNHSVNDILVHGARPLAFMDYVAGHRLTPAAIEAIVAGVARGCRHHGMSLAGGETAQMPGLYTAGTFDLAGTIVGVVDEAAAIHGDRIAPGDTLIAYASTGLHTNGYTLARRVLLDEMQLSLASPLPGTSVPLVDTLLAVHQSYDAAIRPVLGLLHGLAHITGGGIGGNLIRVLPAECSARIDAASWQWPIVFRTIATGGDITVAEMRDVFNLGIGMIAVVPPEAAPKVRAAAASAGVATWDCGTIERGRRAVEFVS
ncbi:MAG: phosphoribosylformylglycinamidine cyclo-ligase [Gemmatimonadales bacterium]